MTRWFIPVTLVATLAFGADAMAHGGTYRGPGDTVPPAGGGAATPTAPTAPTAPATPSTPAAATPATPTSPTTPTVVTAPTVQPTQQAVTGPSTGPDLTTWEFWWEFNKEPYLNLKAKVQDKGTSTGEADGLIGLGGLSTKSNTLAPSAGQISNLILPALQDSLQNDENRDILSSDLVALAKIGRDPNLPTLFQPFLKHTQQEIAETGALAFGILQDAQAIPVLKELLNDSPAGRRMVGSQTDIPFRTRTFAAYGLGLIGHAVNDQALKQDIADTLWTTLTTDTSSFKDLRVASVVSLGLLRLENPADLVAKLSEYLNNEDNGFLEKSHCPNAIAKLLRDGNSDAASVQTAVDLFMGLLSKKSTKNEVRQSCVQALGMVADGNAPYASKVVKTLIDISAKGRDRQEKNFTAVSLAYVGATVANNHPIRSQITEFLIKNVQKGSTAYRPWSALALGVMSFKVNQAGGQVASLVPRTVLEKFKKTKAPSEKACYAISLGLMKNEQAKSEIREALETASDPDLRGYLCVSLGLLSAREHKDYISSVVKESKRMPNLLQQASIGLGLMSDRAVVDALVDLMKGDSDGPPALAVLSATATALGFIGDQRSVRPLVDMLQNDEVTPLGRAFAAVALGIVADKELLPWNSKIAEDLNYRAAVDTLTDPNGSTGILDIL
ncbi:MAG: HEAT repeat domain-containing protein [Planctomycetota bacterium]|nr:MAG: HEAT repeat domain-containing protein [Planctomycetota bacterium]